MQVDHRAGARACAADAASDTEATLRGWDRVG